MESLNVLMTDIITRLSEYVEENRKKQLAERAKLNHIDMFRNAEYAEWDEQVIPIRDKRGEEMTKSQRKRLLKELERQTSCMKEYLKNKE